MDNANKRIARNTIYMYVRLLSTMVIGLYISRLALSILGVSDYGLYAVVGGVLAVFTFISGSLASATSRFFNIEMGKPNGDVNASFNINLTLHICFAIIVMLLAETIGLWYVYNHLNVADNKLDDAVFVYHISMFTVGLGIINTPYQSLLTAHEQFRFMAIVDIANSLLRLVCILLLTLAPANHLRFYSIIFVLTTISNFVAYHWVAYIRWRNIIRFRFVRGWKRYKAVLAFNNWNLLATMAYVANSSGCDLLLNAFFGTVMNGAFAVSKTVKQSIANFTGNFDNASAPQIIQSYAAGDKPRYTYLCNKIGRINILTFEFICFPLLIDLNFVLKLWLGHVPDGAFQLTYLSVIQGGISLTCGGIYNLINATGKIKWFKINVSFFFIICLPIAYGLFKIGFPPYTILVLFIIADIIQRAIQLVLMHYLLGFNSLSYAKEAYVRPLLIALIMSIGIYAYSLCNVTAPWGRVTAIFACAIFNTMLIYFIGLTRNERSKIVKACYARLHWENS